MTIAISAIPAPDPPDAFTCPYAKQCWQREVVRWMLTALIAALAGWLAGCTGSLAWQGWPPGINVDLRWKENGTAATQPSSRPGDPLSPLMNFTIPANGRATTSRPTSR